jgi:hypothetical protein
MWFDVQAALAEIEGAPRAAMAEPPPHVAHVAHVARPPAPKSENAHRAGQDAKAAILNAIRGGKRRPGPIATTTGRGVTATYQLLDRLIAEGSVALTRDGALSMGVKSSGVEKTMP